MREGWTSLLDVGGAYPMSSSRFSNTSPPMVSLSGFRQISIMLYTAFWPQSLSLRALLKCLRPSLGSPVYLRYEVRQRVSW